MLRFRIGEEGIDIVVPFHYGHVVTGDEGRNVGVGKLLPQGPDQWCCADQIANVVATDNQDAGLFFWRVQDTDPTPGGDEKKPLFYGILGNLPGVLF